LLIHRFPALASRNYRLFWSGQFVSLIGSWMQSTVLPYLAYRMSGQPFYLGLIGFASSLPALLFMLPLGVLIERWDKRRTVIIMQIVLMMQAFALAFLTLTGVINIWYIIGLAFISGMANAVEITARQAMIVELVGKEALPNAIALNSTAFNLARVIGPSLTAPFLVLLQDNGEGWAFFANGVSYLFVIVGLLFVNSRSKIKPQAENRSILTGFKEGQVYIRGTSTVALIISLVAIFGFFGFPFGQQIPVFARDVLQSAGDTNAAVATRNSLLVTAQGVGALIAAVSLAVFSTIRRKGLALSAGQVVFAAALIGLSASRSMGTTLPLMVLVGWGMVTQLALANTLIQLAVPDELRGRVISTYLWAMQGIAPFGSLFLGMLAQNWGAPAAVALGGSVCLIAAISIHSFQPAVRRITV